jgi:hypothetical protein
VAKLEKGIPSRLYSQGYILEPEVVVDIAADGAVGAHNFLDLVLDKEVV